MAAAFGAGAWRRKGALAVDCVMKDATVVRRRTHTQDSRAVKMIDEDDSHHRSWIGSAAGMIVRPRYRVIVFAITFFFMMMINTDKGTDRPDSQIELTDSLRASYRSLIIAFCGPRTAPGL